jgi:hypothetical protein
MNVAAMFAAPSIEPAPGLVIPANPGSGQPCQFALFGDSWIDLQAYAGAASELPMTRREFEHKYGAVAGSRILAGCIEAMKGVQAASTEFGDPKCLRATLRTSPNLLATRQPPQDIYTHTAWLSQRVAQTAGSIAIGFEDAMADLPSLPPREQVDSLKAHLFDQPLGPVALSKKISDEVGMLIRKFGKFGQKMNECNDRLTAYTSSWSPLIAELDTAIGSLAQPIAGLGKSRADAWLAWRDFTIAAATGSVRCMLIGGLLAPFTGAVSLLSGGPAAIALEVGLGVKAARCRALYNEYCSQIAGQPDQLKKRQRLRSDLGDFDTQLQRAALAMTNFLDRLQVLEGAWVHMNSDLLAIGNSITEKNVGTLPFLVKAMSLAAIHSWRSVGASAGRFTAGSLIDYTSLAFGDTMPEN